MAKAGTKNKKENALIRYFKETRAELKKVTWPTRQEAQVLTGVVLAVTIAMAVLLGLLDLVFDRLLGAILDKEILAIILAVVILAGLFVAGRLLGRE